MRAGDSPEEQRLLAMQGRDRAPRSGRLPRLSRRLRMQPWHRGHSGQSKAVNKGIIGVVVGAQEEAAFGTAAGDHVVTTGDDLAGECHTCDVGHAGRKLRKKVPSDGI